MCFGRTCTKFLSPQRFYYYLAVLRSASSLALPPVLPCERAADRCTKDTSSLQAKIGISHIVQAQMPWFYSLQHIPQDNILDLITGGGTLRTMIILRHKRRFLGGRRTQISMP